MQKSGDTSPLNKMKGKWMCQTILWVEQHPVLIGAASTLITGAFAILAGFLAFSGAIRQAKAVEKQTLASTLHQEQEATRQAFNKAAIVAAEVRDLVKRAVSLHNSIGEQRALPTFTDKFMDRVTVFSHNPEIISSLSGDTAAQAINFYGVYHLEQIALMDYNGSSLTERELKHELAGLTTVAEKGLELLSELQKTYGIFKDFDSWADERRNVLHATNVANNIVQSE